MAKTPYILRKANGDILTVDINGRPAIAVWEDERAVRRSKLANPELIVYVPAPLTRQLVERRFPNLDVSFFLVDSRDPDLKTGREMNPADLFSQLELAEAA